jgi:hypothetical protein
MQSEGGSAEQVKLLAFKALRKDLVRDFEKPGSEIRLTSRGQVEQIVEHLRLVCEDIGATSQDDADFVREEAIVSLDEAKSQLGIIDRLNHEIKVSLVSLFLDVHADGTAWYGQIGRISFGCNSLNQPVRVIVDVATNKAMLFTSLAFSLVSSTDSSSHQ